MSKPLEMNCCPCCGYALVAKFLFGHVRRKCPDCGFIFFRDPKVAAGILAEQDGKVVLAKRLYDLRQGRLGTASRFGEESFHPSLHDLAEEANRCLF